MPRLTFHAVPLLSACLVACGGTERLSSLDAVVAPPREDAGALATEDTSEKCRDSLDNDENELTDCEDPGCADFVFCQNDAGESEQRDASAIPEEIDAGLGPRADAALPGPDAGLPALDAGRTDASGLEGYAGGLMRKCAAHSDCPEGMICLEAVEPSEGSAFCTYACNEEVTGTCPDIDWVFCTAGYCMQFCTTSDLPCPAPYVCPDVTGTGAGMCVPPP